MRAARRSLDVQHGLIWVEAAVTTPDGRIRDIRLVLDTGTPNTILSSEVAAELGYPESVAAGVATFDTPDGPVLGYTSRIPALVALGLEVNNYLVGVKLFHSRLHVPGILGLDFFEGTDLLLSFRNRSIHLAW